MHRNSLHQMSTVQDKFEHFAEERDLFPCQPVRRPVPGTQTTDILNLIECSFKVSRDRIRALGKNRCETSIQKY